jgi:DNA-binding NarL/FixJ family response regulator
LINICPQCGGVGDLWDEAAGDWVVPREPCARCDGRGQTGTVTVTSQPALYDMAARITELILTREAALSLLNRAPNDRYVLAAIRALEGDVDAGSTGGPARYVPDSMDTMARSMSRLATDGKNGKEVESARRATRTGTRRSARASTQPTAVQANNISASEERVVELLFDGMSNPEIAEVLCLSPDTVKSHLRNLYIKFRVRNRVQLLLAISKQAA